MAAAPCLAVHPPAGYYPGDPLCQPCALPYFSLPNTSEPSMIVPPGQTNPSTFAPKLEGWVSPVDSSSSSFTATPTGPSRPPAPAFGVKVVQNGRTVLEDAYSAHLDIVSVSSSGSESSYLDICDRSPSCSSGISQNGNATTDACDLDSLSLFGVYDGHGGSEAAEHCASRLHRNFLDSLASDHVSLNSRTSSMHSSLPEGSWNSETSGLPPVINAMDVDTPTSSSAKGEQGMWACTAAGDRTSQVISQALRQAFLKTDSELAGTEVGELVGSTAVVAVVGKNEVHVAHCGKWYRQQQ
eukprot:jgi/Chrzof1/14685/Cz09g12010.t1